jgi:hypothetical protein
MPPISDESYRHWGTLTYADDSREQEPNNLQVRAPELCGVGNYTQAYGNDTALPFGWADQNCTASHIVICKTSEPGVSPWYPTNSTNITFYLNTSLVGALHVGLHAVARARAGLLAVHACRLLQARRQQQARLCGCEGLCVL